MENLWFMALRPGRIAVSRKAVVTYWRKYVHKVLVNCLGDLSLPRKSVVRLTDHPDMTLTHTCHISHCEMKSHRFQPF